jgi:uncharacterized membrane protein YeaQ/YmgE (transglycosylase-associated protein family)
MNLIIWLLAGAAVGLLSSMFIHRRRSAWLSNIVFGMVGAVVAGYLLPRMFGVDMTRTGSFSLPSLLIALGGAVVLLSIVNFFRRENNVNSEEIERRWPQIRGKVHTRWTKLTEADVDSIDGNYDRFRYQLQTHYGYSAKVAEGQIQEYIKAVLQESDGS